MPKRPHTSLLFIILALALLLLSVQSVYAGGQQEDPLETAENQIEEGNYDDAVLTLTQMLRDDPERLEEAEALMDEIRKIRNNFNDVLEELMTVFDEMRNLIDLEENSERAVALIDQLKSIDPSPNTKTSRFVASLSATAHLVYNEAIFKGIMLAAEEELQSGSYWTAIATYLTGTSLHEEDFKNANFGNIVENGVMGEVTQLIEQSELLIGRKENVQSAVASFLASIATEDTNEIRSEIESFKGEIERQEVITGSIIGAAQALQKWREQIVFDQTDIHTAAERYLSYLYQYVFGRPDAEVKEGIKGAADIFTADSVERAAGLLEEVSRKKESSAESSFNSEDWSAAETEYAAAAESFRFLLETLDLWKLDITLQSDFSVSAEDRILLNEKLPKYLETRTSIKSALSLSELARIRVNWLQIAERSFNTIDELDTRRTELLEQLEILNNSFTTWTNKNSSYQAGMDAFSSTAEGRQISDTLAKISQSIDFYILKEIEIVDARAQIEKQPLLSRYEEESTSVEEARNLKNGIENTFTKEDGEELEIVSKYPADAITIFDETAEDLAALLNQVNNYINSYRQEKEYISEADEIQTHLAQMVSIRSGIQDLQDEIPILIAESEEQIRLAARFRDEGFLRIEEAQAALERDDFERALEALSTAQERFFASLTNREDFDFRRESDNLILSLNDAIIDRKNELVVIEVNRLVEEGRRLYLRDDFAEAENVLLDAQELWFSTKVAENPKIRRWLNLVQAALTARSGREITENDPLFGVMVPILNLAKKDYDEGRKLLDEGNEDAAEEKLRSAEDKIQKVILQFPFNQEARVLSLRIERLLNRENFETLFAERLEDATIKLNTDPNDAYADLLDLKTIIPDYPGLDDTIYRAELILGIQEPPPNQKNIAESNRLYEEAQRIVDRNITAQFPIALEQLNRALELYPDNNQAQELWDEIQIGQGGQTSVVLSSIAMEQFRQAQQFAVNNENVLALRIIRELLADPENQGYIPLIRLNETVSMRLGVEVQ